jgi:hypothetical protein
MGNGVREALLLSPHGAKCCQFNLCCFCGLTVSGHKSVRLAKITPKTAKTPTLILRKSSAFLNQNNNPFNTRLITTSYYIYSNIGLLEVSICDITY